MRALIARDGHWDAVELPVPEIRPHEVLVRVFSAGVNRADLDELAGTYRGKAVDPSRPDVAGAELAGIVERVGAGVTGVSPGQAVMAMSNGAFAELVAVDARLLLPVPDGLDWVHAAALPVACLTEYDALVTRGGLTTGQSVLVLGVSSGVGMYGAALARQLGATPVFGTSRARAKLRRIDAIDVAVDTSVDDLAAVVLEHTGGVGVDVVIDHVGGELTDRAVAATHVGGTVVQVGRLAGDRALLDLDRLAYRRVTLMGTTFRTRALEEIATVVSEVRAHVLPAAVDGELFAAVDRVFSFIEAECAYTHLADDTSVGKVVLTMEGS